MNALKMSVAVSAVLAVCVSTAAVAKPTLLPPDAPPLARTVAPPPLETPTSAIVMISAGSLAVLAGSTIAMLGILSSLIHLADGDIWGAVFSPGLLIGI